MAPFTAYCALCAHSVCSQCTHDHDQQPRLPSCTSLRAQYNTFAASPKPVQPKAPVNALAALQALLDPAASEGVYGEDAESYGGVGFRAICNEKPLVVLDVLKRGLNVLWTDTDIVWHADPLAYIKQLDTTYPCASIDMYIQQDDDDICAGFYYIRSNARTIAYMETVIAFLNPIVDDQISMRKFLKEKAINITSPTSFDQAGDKLRYVKLSRSLFPNGTAYFNLKIPQRMNVSPIIVHNNCIIGHRSKKERFLAYGLWLVKDCDLDVSPIVAPLSTPVTPIKILKGHFDIITGISSCQDRIYSTSIDKSIKLWDYNNNKIIKSKYIHKRGAVWGLLTPGSGAIEGCHSVSTVTASHDKTVVTWDDDMNALQTYGGHYGVINGIKMAGNNMFITCSDDHTIRVFSFTDSTYKRVFLGHSGWVSSVDLHNNILYSCSNDQSIRFWDFSSGRCTNIIQAGQGWVRSITLNIGANQLLSAGNDGSIKYWDLNTNENVKTIYPCQDKSSVCGMIIHLDILYVSCDNGSLKSFNVSNGEFIQEYEGHAPHPINCMHIAKDMSEGGGLLFTGGFDKLIKSWPLSTIIKH
eukprot:gene1536-1793_t